jgi:hypothetical protein
MPQSRRRHAHAAVKLVKLLSKISNGLLTRFLRFGIIA